MRELCDGLFFGDSGSGYKILFSFLRGCKMRRGQCTAERGLGVGRTVTAVTAELLPRTLFLASKAAT